MELLESSAGGQLQDVSFAGRSEGSRSTSRTSARRSLGISPGTLRSALGCRRAPAAWAQWRKADSRVADSTGTLKGASSTKSEPVRPMFAQNRALSADCGGSGRLRSVIGPLTAEPGLARGVWRLALLILLLWGKQSPGTLARSGGFLASSTSRLILDRPLCLCVCSAVDWRVVHVIGSQSAVAMSRHGLPRKAYRSYLPPHCRAGLSGPASGVLDVVLSKAAGLSLHLSKHERLAHLKAGASSVQQAFSMPARAHRQGERRILVGLIATHARPGDSGHVSGCWLGL